MNKSIQEVSKRNLTVIKWLTYLMFMMFAMTTDAVGEIIKEVMKQFNLSMTSAGLLHYGPMTAIALGGIFLGFLSDKIGRKKTIIIGLALFAQLIPLYHRKLIRFFSCLADDLRSGNRHFQNGGIGPDRRYFHINRTTYHHHECG